MAQEGSRCIKVHNITAGEELCEASNCPKALTSKDKLIIMGGNKLFIKTRMRLGKKLSLCKSGPALSL